MNHRLNRSLTVATLLVVLAMALGACTSTPALTLGIGSTQVSDKDGMTLLYVPAGEFTMGSNSDHADEKPVHTVYLDAFWIDQTEVTNAMFRQFVAATTYRTEANWQHPSGGPHSNLDGFENHPVVEVSWNDAKAYCEWAGRRLPTEAEWEKAARGTDGRIYPWGNQPPDHAGLTYNWEVMTTTQVGSHPTGASPYGALNMLGNVWEWVADWYGETYYASSPDRNPTGPTSGYYHVLRGGCYDFASDVRASKRGNDYPYELYCYVGFRCAR